MELFSSTRNILDDFREAYYWLRQNTDEHARVMSWWDYGYQIAGMANRTTLVDNNTWNNSHIALVRVAVFCAAETPKCSHCSPGWSCSCLLGWLILRRNCRVGNTNVEWTHFFHLLKLKSRVQFCSRVFILITWSFQNFTYTSVSLLFFGGG